MPIVSRVWVWFTKYVRATPGKLRKVRAWFKKHENTRKFILRCIVVIFILLLLSAILAMLVIMLQVILYPNVTSALMKLTDIDAKPELLKFIGLGVSGIIATLGVVGLLLRAAALDAQNKLTEKGHIHERFKAATEHLGNKESVSVRIASFSEFYRLAEITAKITEEKGLKETIFYILCAHLRQTTRNKDYKKEVEYLDTEESKNIKPTVEVHDLLDILFKPESKADFIFGGLKANLRRANLQGASLQGVDLKNANLQMVNLQETKLKEAELKKARMWRAKLQMANLQMANLQEANLKEAELQKANLYGANLQGADLQGANLENANLLETNLLESNLLGATINKSTTMPDEWKDMVEKDEKGKTGVLLVDDEENIIESY